MEAPDDSAAYRDQMIQDIKDLRSEGIDNALPRILHREHVRNNSNSTVDSVGDDMLKLLHVTRHLHYNTSRSDLGVFNESGDYYLSPFTHQDHRTNLQEHQNRMGIYNEAMSYYEDLVRKYARLYEVFDGYNREVAFNEDRSWSIFEDWDRIDRYRYHEFPDVHGNVDVSDGNLHLGPQTDNISREDLNRITFDDLMDHYTNFLKEMLHGYDRRTFIEPRDDETDEETAAAEADARRVYRNVYEELVARTSSGASRKGETRSLSRNRRYDQYDSLHDIFRNDVMATHLQKLAQQRTIRNQYQQSQLWQNENFDRPRTSNRRQTNIELNPPEGWGTHSRPRPFNFQEISYNVQTGQPYTPRNNPRPMGASSRMAYMIFT